MAFPSTFLDLQQDVIEKARLDASDDSSRVKDWLNNAYWTACIETGFYQSSSASTALSAAATSVAVPAAIKKIEYIVPTGSSGTLWGPMAQVTFEELLELRAYSGATISSGAPSRFAMRSAQAPTIEFYPNAVGGEILTFYGQFLPAAMTADTDLPIFGEPYAQVIAYGALIDACEFKKDLLMVQQFQQGYQDWLQRLRGFNNTKVGAKVQQFRIEGRSPIRQRNDVDTGY